MIWVREISGSFLPVGQGLSCLTNLKVRSSIKKHERWSILYDFGGLNIKYVKDSIQYIPQKIHLFIISHLHVDHISGIPFLKKKKIKFEEIWLPYISKKMKIFYLLDIYIRGIELEWGDEHISEMVNFIKDPADYFSKLGQVRYIGKEGIEKREFQKNKEKVYKKKFPEDILKKDKFHLNYNYQIGEFNVFISRYPVFEVKVFDNIFSHEDKIIGAMVSAIRDLLDVNNIDEILNNPDKIINALSNNKIKKGLINIYKSVFPELNDSSLAVSIMANDFPNSLRVDYIGIDENLDMSLNTLTKNKQYNQRYSNTLVLTGDLEKRGLKYIREIKSFFLQVPHHGGYSSFDRSFYDSNKFSVGIISCGLNQNRHPDLKVFLEISKMLFCSVICHEDKMVNFYHQIEDWI